MTTSNDNLNERQLRLGPITVQQGVETDLYSDATGVYPKFENWYTSTTPRVSIGADYTSLSLVGGFDKLISSDPVPSQRTMNRATTTATGHSFEMDDTPGNERIILKHNSGNGVEIRQDGRMIIASGSQVISVSKEQHITILGDAKIVYGGNVDMEIAGDYNVKVNGEYKLSVGEDKIEEIEGSSRTTVEKNTGHITKGHSSKTVIKSMTNTILGDMTQAIKGVARFVSQDNMYLSSGSVTQISARAKLHQSSANMNIAATNLSVFGATGTIGGRDVTMYGKGATFVEGVTAPTFHGSLKGIAQIARSQSYGESVTSGGTAITDVATPTTAEPNTENVNDLLFNTTIGAVDVKVDIDDHLLRALDKTKATGGFSTKELNIQEVRAALRTPSNKTNTAFIGQAIASGVLSPSYAKTNPPNLVEIKSKKSSPRTSRNSAGSASRGNNIAFVVPDTNPSVNYQPDIVIKNDAVINNKTKLSGSVTLATYTGAKGATGVISQVPTKDRAQIARNFQVNADILQKYNDPQFKNEMHNYRIVVVEGLYNVRPNDTKSKGWSDSINKYKSEGRAAVWEIQNESGIVDIEKTYWFADLLKDLANTQKIILDYDSYDPKVPLSCQLIIISPMLNESYDVTDGNFKSEVETRYNGNILSSSDLILHEL